MWHFDRNNDESYLRREIMPLEALLIKFKRIVIKDSAVNAVCYGAILIITGLLRFEEGIEINEQVVIMTTKGEAVAMGVAQMNTTMLVSYDHGPVAKIKTVIMNRDTYPMRWGFGPVAQLRKKLMYYQ